MFALSKLEAFADNKINQMLTLHSIDTHFEQQKVLEKFVGKRRNCL